MTFPIYTKDELVHNVRRGGTIPVANYQNMRVEISLEISLPADTPRTALAEILGDTMNDIDLIIGHSLLGVFQQNSGIEDISRDEITEYLNAAIDRNILQHLATSPYAKHVLRMVAIEQLKSKKTTVSTDSVVIDREDSNNGN